MGEGLFSRLMRGKQVPQPLAGLKSYVAVGPTKGASPALAQASSVSSTCASCV